ncbi:MAG: hypothetical protein ERJ68_04385 [Aphanocapsa feldmannii 277cI]|uniref:Uncharacterized protein n=1 Tax=Aphanocapsa feldmannii 277cI TaxID=2507554 RepID=A0A524RTT8_9CHRO|nr:MAG: hypothetical protein ERJ68_04385 [Aphanocapsa feldmannii 277cI]
MRETLARQLPQAVFLLCTQRFPRRFGQLHGAERSRLRQHLDQLLQRCTVLLTVEQLVPLAQRLQWERRKDRQRGAEAALQLLHEGHPSRDAAAGTGPAEPRDPAEAAPAEGVSPHRRGGDIDLDNAWHTVWLSKGPTSQETADEGPDEGPADPQQAAGDSSAFAADPSDARSDDAQDRDPGRPQGEPASFAALEHMLMQQQCDDDDLLRMLTPADRGLPSVDPTLQQTPEGPGPTGPRRDRQGGEAPTTISAPLEGGDSRLLSSLLQSDDDDGLLRPGDDPQLEGLPLPRRPDRLRRWLRWYKRALMRRLRNLSYAVNVELLRSRVVRTLVPVKLLDAALTGQAEALPAPANLLHLVLPLGPEVPDAEDGEAEPSRGQLDVHAVLLRLEDMEFEHPPLRRLRQQIRQHEVRLHRLAERYWHWQNCLEVSGAEQQWLQAIRSSQAPPRSGGSASGP